MVCACSHKRAKAATNFPPKENYLMDLKIKTEHTLLAVGLAFQNVMP
jgi:hypothetical protein